MEKQHRQLEESSIHRRFHPARVSDDLDGAIQIIRWGFENMAQTLEDILPPGRYKDTCHDRLEEAAMWAMKAIMQGQPLADPPRLPGRGAL